MTMTSLPSSRALRCMYDRGVTPDKWGARWNEARRDMPVVLELAEGITALNALAAGGCDIAITRLPTTFEEFASYGADINCEDYFVVRLYEESAGVAAWKEHPVALQHDWRAEDLQGERFHEIFPPNGVFSSSSSELADHDLSGHIEMVRANIHLLIAPFSVIRAEAGKSIPVARIIDRPAGWVAAIFPKSADCDDIQDFIGVLKGRKAASSRRSERPRVAQKKGAGKKTSGKKISQSRKPAAKGRAGVRRRK